MYTKLNNDLQTRLNQLHHEKEQLIANINAYNGAIEELNRLIIVLKGKEKEDEGIEAGTDDNNHGNPVV